MCGSECGGALHESRPDIVHFGCGRSLLWGGLMSAGIKGPKRVTTRRIDYPIGGGLRAMRYRHLVHHVVVNCRSVYDRVRGAGVPRERITLIYEGVDGAAWRGVRGHRELSRVRLDLPKHAVVISQAATLTPRKGQIYLLEAFRQCGGGVSQGNAGVRRGRQRHAAPSLPRRRVGRRGQGAHAGSDPADPRSLCRHRPVLHETPFTRGLPTPVWRQAPLVCPRW